VAKSNIRGAGWFISGASSCSIWSACRKFGNQEARKIFQASGFLISKSIPGKPVSSAWLLSRDDSERWTPMTNAGAPRIQTEVQVMFFDTDCGGVVHNIAYLRFIEIARTLLAEKLGMKLVEMAQTQCYPVVVRTEIDYRRGAKLGDRLRIDGWLERLERVRFWCGFQIRRLDDQALIAESRQMLALLQMPEAKLLRLPEAWERYRELETTARR
jgi:YbgC/YbaW family acyl-CoA thioester hydrolase